MALPVMPAVVLGPHGQHHERRRGPDRIARGAPAADRSGHAGVPRRTRSPASAPASSRTTTRPASVEKWRVTHNVWLQVAAELGIVRPADVRVPGHARLQRQLRGDAPAAAAARKRAGPAAVRANGGTAISALTDEERRTLDLNAKGMLAAMVGWTVCSLFASVAFNWTFYYVLALAVAGREMLAARRAAAKAAEAAAPISAVPRSRLIRVHA